MYLNTGKFHIPWLVTGTVRSRKKPLQYVPAPDHVGIACVTTPQAQKHRSIAIPPIDIATAWASLTGVRRSHRLEMNTVHFTGLLKPPQPVPICPGTDRTPNISAQSAFEFTLVVQVLQSFNDYAVHVLDVAKDFLDHLVHALFEGSTGLFLTVGAMFAALDPFHHTLGVQSELLARIHRGKGINASVYSNSFGAFERFAGINFKGELDILVGDDVAIESLALGS